MQVIWIGTTMVWPVNRFWLILSFPLLMVSACGEASQRESTQPSGYSAASDAAISETSVDAEADAHADLAAATYEETAGSSDCTDDCSGHEAGFEYAKENEIADPDDCGGNSESFIAGCREYGEEIARRAVDAAE